jgi:hypothetical protein
MVYTSHLDHHDDETMPQTQSLHTGIKRRQGLKLDILDQRDTETPTRNSFEDALEQS